MNLYAVRAIYRYEMARTARTLFQSVVSPVISTALYFIVFGAAIGSRITQIDGVSYGAFIVPGLIMLTLLTQSVTNAAFGIYFPRFVGTIYELLSAPVSSFEIVVGYVGAATTKSVLLGTIRFGQRGQQPQLLGCTDRLTTGEAHSQAGQGIPQGNDGTHPVDHSVLSVSVVHGGVGAPPKLGHEQAGVLRIGDVVAHDRHVVVPAPAHRGFD